MKRFLQLITIISATLALQASDDSKIEMFLKDKLGLSDLDAWFGNAPESFGTIEKLNPRRPNLPINAEYTWYVTPQNKKCENNLPGKTFQFGFKDGKMAVIRMFTGLVKKDETEWNNHLMHFIKDNGSRKLTSNGYTFMDGTWKIQYMPYCSPGENIFGVLHITKQPEGVSRISLPKL